MVGEATLIRLVIFVVHFLFIDVLNFIIYLDVNIFLNHKPAINIIFISCCIWFRFYILMLIMPCSMFILTWVVA